MRFHRYLSCVVALLTTSARGGQIFFHPPASRVGAICVGPDLSKTNREKNIFFSVDGSLKVPFSGAQGSLPFNNLSLEKTHEMTLLKGDKEIKKLKFRFRKLKPNFLVFWKTAGGWQLMPVGGDKCEWPVPRCPKGRACR